MDPQNTDLVIMLDESLSMRSREKAARMQMEAILRRQNKRQEQCRVSVLLADAECRLLYDRVPIEVVHPPTKDGKRPGEASALRDAILKGIRYVERNQHDLKDEKHASKVVFQIISDGIDNTSRISRETLKEAIKQKQSLGWQFSYVCPEAENALCRANRGADNWDLLDRERLNRRVEQVIQEIIANKKH